MTDPGFAARAMGDTKWNTGNFKNRITAALMGGQGYGADEADYEKRARGFNAGQSVNDYAQGAWSNITDSVGGLKDILTKLKGSAVGAGRLDTGFYDEDQGQVVNRAMESLNADIAQQSVAATGLDLRNQEDLGSWAEGKRNTYLDLLSGATDRATADDNARRARRSGFWGAIGTAAGAAAGSIVPGLGTVAGAKLGNTIGSGLGG